MSPNAIQDSAHPPAKPHGGPIRVVGLGGTTRAGSSTERALSTLLEEIGRTGAETRLFDGAFLSRLPHYGPGAAAGSPEAMELVRTVREADAVVIGSPGYHGSISGLVKNALDFLEETAGDSRPYLHGVPVGLVATAFGSQASASTLAAMRSIVHALRGWPTPLGVCIDTSEAGTSGPGAGRTSQQLNILANQLIEGAKAFGGRPA